MALIKQPLDISFAQGLDTKTDPFRVQPGKFLSLNNSIFDKAGRLTKRNGYGLLPSLPNSSFKYLTTFNENLTAIGSRLLALSIGTKQWVDKGQVLPVSLNTLPLIRSNTNQSQADSVISSNGLVCTVYTDQVPVMGSNVAQYKYVIADSITGQNIISPTLLITGGSTVGTPRVFLLGNYFIILYTNLISAVSHLQYIAVSTFDPMIVTSPVDIASVYIPSTTVNFDGIVANNNLYIAYNTTTGGQSVKVTYISTRLGNPATAVTYAAQIATMFSLTADNTTPSSPIIYVSYYNLPTTTGKVLAIDQHLNPVLAPTTIISSGNYLNLASTAINGVVTVFAERSNAYSYDSGIPTNFIQSITVTQAGVVGSLVVVVRSVGLASKAFLYNGSSYFLTVYNSPFQPSYFLIDSMTGNVVAKLAYSNAGPYDATGIPSAILGSDGIVRIAYLIKDLIAASATTGNTATSPVYSQTGINLIQISPMPSITTSEIATTLNISGGFITSYDGYSPVEQGFFVWPDSVEATPHTTGGSMTDQEYFYQVTYEWSDNQGNLIRSSPSIPISATVSGGSGSGSVTVNVPTLRLTYKLANPVKIVVYRWSTAQQTYFQTTSMLIPVLNNPAVDSIAILDTNSDSSIDGNEILYTVGGTIENISPPASDLLTLFNNRLWLVDSEDRNLLWFSKQVIEATPVEMSDLLTLYIAPTTGSEGSTGPITAIAPMDDKLIVYKANAVGFINGIGPDNTGANSQYSDFILINSVVGCTNQSSIVLIPSGLMFQTNKGIWLLGRDLSTQYIGAPVESFTQGALVQSAVNIPGTNQVRFTLDTGITLMYDYYYSQWGTFSNVPAVSATIYEGLHSYINSLGQVLQESPGAYIDNTSPVLMSFTTGWMNLAGLQGYERFYSMFLLGQYITPFKLNVQLAYDYNSSMQQATIVTPQAPTGAWGSDALWGSSSPWGGQSSIFEARVFPTIQKCESFQITINELYDPSYSIAAGAGLTLSGLNLSVGIKKPFRTSSAGRNFG